MKIAPLAEVKNQLSDYIRQSESEPVVITRNGKPAAMLIAIKNEDEIEHFLMSHNPKLRHMLDKIMERMDREGGIDEDTFWKEVEQPISTREEKIS